MTPSQDTIFTVAPYLKPYLNLNRFTGDLYYFRKESTSLLDASGNKRIWHPKIEHEMLREHHSSNEGLLYVALPAQANINNLIGEDLLYVGCAQSGCSRYWRGKINATTRFPKPKSCFHHQQMRNGRDGCLETYLPSGGKVRVYTLTNEEVMNIARKHNIQLLHGNYPSHQLEGKYFQKVTKNGNGIHGNENHINTIGNDDHRTDRSLSSHGEDGIYHY